MIIGTYLSLDMKIHTVFNRDAAEQSFADGDGYFILGSAQSLNGEHKLEKSLSVNCMTVFRAVRNPA